MSELKVSATDRIGIEKAIHLYFDSLRKEVETFVASHFSWQQTLQLQRRFFFSDLFLYPLNALWTIPFLALKQSTDSLQKLGLAQFSKKLSGLPSGIRTRYQKELERLISEKILKMQLSHPADEKSELTRQIQSATSSLFQDKANIESYLNLSHHLRVELEKYSTSRQFVSDIAGNLSLMGLGWTLFGNHSLSLTALGEKLARLFASDKAASSFVFGKKLGTSFYHFFPPAPNQTQILIYTLAVGLLFTISSLCIHIASDPLRKRFGLHRAGLLQLLDGLEASLLLEISLNYKRINLSQEAMETKAMAPRKSSEAS